MIGLEYEGERDPLRRRGLLGVAATMLSVGLWPAVPANATDEASAEEPATGHWQPVAMVTAEARAAGVTLGGEGCQWPQSIEVDQVDGDFLLFLSDVGGVWRSLDGSKTWEPCNVGFTPRGATDAAIDPHFPHRILMSGMNSMGSKFNGVYLSEDRAASWRPVQLASYSGFADRRVKLAFDPTTRDDAAGMTRVAYWSRTDDRAKPDNWGDMDINPGLYRSDDGGATWARLNPAASDAAGHSALAVHAESGRVFAANERGVFISDDRGESFRQTLAIPVTSIAVVPHRPDEVWVTLVDGLMYSSDAGQTWAAVETVGLDEPLVGTDGQREATPRQNVRFQDLQISPADPDRMAMSSHADDWRFHRHISHDGGRTWATASVEPTHAFMPQNERDGIYAWHPTDPDRVWSFGGDWPTASTDGGQTYHWAGNGQNAIFVGGTFNLNPHHPGLLFLSSQDYNGGVTRDHGHTWSYTNVSGFGWGGFAYSGLALSPDVLAAGLSDGGWSVPRRLKVSRDGGATWTEVADHYWVTDRSHPNYGYDTGLVHPLDPNIAFVSHYRTDDLGQTWTDLEGCSGVFAADADGRLYGAQARAQEADVVVSDDHGLTWSVLCTVPGTIDDLSVTADGRSVYLASQNRLWRISTSMDASAVIGSPLLLVSTPKTGTGLHRVATVSVDPQNPQRIYVGQRIDLHAADVGVLRSEDGGVTWTNLNLTEPLDGQRLDGGREPQCVRVDPHTGDLWVTTGCYGVWKFVTE